MALLSTTYNSEAELIRFLSQNGFDDALDNDLDGTADTEVANDCINQAAGEIELYGRMRYTQAQLASSDLIKRWSIICSAKFAFERRGNVVPASIAAEWDRIMDPQQGKLPLIARGRLELPGIALRGDLRPTFSNLEVDRKWLHSTIRRTNENSSDASTALSRDNAHGGLNWSGL
jgi:hypothetical protein